MQRAEWSEYFGIMTSLSSRDDASKLLRCSGKQLLRKRFKQQQNIRRGQKGILVNIYREEVEVNIYQGSLSLRRIIVLF